MGWQGKFGRGACNCFSAMAAASAICVHVAIAQAPAAQGSVKDEMHQAYRAFKDLQRYLYAREDFLDPEKEPEIRELLSKLQGSFHAVEGEDAKFKNDAGFASTLKIMNEMLDDARHRFGEGKKNYALWRLKTAANYCISCHTRYEVPTTFADDSVDLQRMNAFERGEFFLATRQFGQAIDNFRAAIYSAELDTIRMEALRSLLVVYTRVQNKPREALADFRKILSRVALKQYELEEVRSWVNSLERWTNEREAKIPPVTKAENLIRQGLGMNDPLTGQKGTVELMRATSILHEAMEKRVADTPESQSNILYLLGLCYSELPLYFANELPELLLEQAIREAPGTVTAQKAYRRYKEIVTLGYTGSGGTRLPDEILLMFRELHDIAYGVKTLKQQV